MSFRTLAEMLKQSVEKYSDLMCSQMLGNTKMTFKELGERVEKVKEMLVGAGLREGDKVALYSSSHSNWAVCYMATVSAGMVIVPILPDFSEVELEKILEHSEAKALCVSDKLYTKVSKERVAKSNIVIRTKNLSVLAQNVSEQGSMAEPKPEDLAAIIYTSGTTSSPKGVMHTHQSLCSQLHLLQNLYPIHRDDVWLSVLPLSHTYECSLGMLFPMSRGSNVTYLDRPPTVSVLLPALKQVRPTIMLIVPLIIEKIFKHQVLATFNSKAITRTLYGWAPTRRLLHRVASTKLTKVFGGRVRFLGIGGAKLDPQAEQFLLDGKFNYAIGYGLTETAPLIAGALPGLTRLSSTGPVMEGVEVRLDNLNEKGEGELVAKTPSVMTGYYKNPEATAEVFTEDGWFRTRDIATIADDGYISIKGRVNSMIVGPSGENIYPEEIEHVINSNSLVAESIVTMEEGRLVALVNFNREELERRYYDFKDDLTEKMEEVKKEVMQYVNSQVNKFSRIAEVEEVDEFQKTPSMKIKRFLYNNRKKQEKK